ncbi:MAG: glutaredoxin domain-containing protein [Nannocystaceae bacterium]
MPDAATTAGMNAPPAGLAPPEELSAAVVLYSTWWCPWCRLAKRLLGKRGIEFVELDVDTPAARRWLAQRTGHQTVPQIFVRGESIGGYDELAAMDASGALARALAPL